jgi:hypothetical protein
VPTNRQFEVNGVVVVSIFTPANEGRSELDTIVDSVVNTLEAKRIPGEEIVFFAATTKELGQDGPFLHGNVTVPFVFRELK